ncbi:glycerophosphoryl diester phosphodiesterase [Mobilisporobacter senegalensis]|uniref:Glycerophosphoryl diester phosphodiesterase n=1 Tax=Mobilisporobacter senegalensis TaxID=1329262 RepID=A0A3N1XI75_9FIRM|nr:glycerophosphodiester phosphodiesterase family protein [Mobilisporobacter senegalensis]ROR26403.1 glycerophosphoryl diester phosphodiesterase [Mobilisporobacter senegalensis]
MIFYFIGGFIVIVILYLLAIMPRMLNRPDIAPFKGQYYAHRGFHDNFSDAPENSLKAFELAAIKGYGIELDVQLTKDRIPVVFHDYSLKRVCGVNKKVKELTYEELKELKLFRSKERIPLLREALDLIHGRVPLIIELKIPYNPKDTCEKTDEILRKYRGVYCIESFNPLGLIWYKKKHPNILRGQLSTDYFKDKEKGNKFQFFLLQNLLLNFLAKPDFIAYHYIHGKKLSFWICTKVYKAHAFAWTIKSQEALVESQKNFKYFIFDSFIPE